MKVGKRVKIKNHRTGQFVGGVITEVSPRLLIVRPDGVATDRAFLRSTNRNVKSDYLELISYAIV